MGRISLKLSHQATDWINALRKTYQYPQSSKEGLLYNPQLTRVSSVPSVFEKCTCLVEPWLLAGSLARDQVFSITNVLQRGWDSEVATGSIPEFLQQEGRQWAAPGSSRLPSAPLSLQ